MGGLLKVRQQVWDTFAWTFKSLLKNLPYLAAFEDAFVGEPWQYLAVQRPEIVPLDRQGGSELAVMGKQEAKVDLLDAEAPPIPKMALVMSGHQLALLSLAVG